MFVYGPEIHWERAIMLNGIFHVSFQSSLATVGEGLAVFDACGVHGANENHIFRGAQADNGGATILTVEIRHLHGEKYPTFGPLGAVNLELTVSKDTGDGFRAEGSIREAKGIRLHVVGRKLGELVQAK
ncbi:MAG: hypothetical protein CVU73_09435 [Deltaproteobacteria bacterium HGW-Deltaproteobacteria-8]|nr:MAG: hypothetical protein CVU73_09435 [Deltaproteobacteria bacterium HGW-Deltaproteobacteria-8]